MAPKFLSATTILHPSPKQTRKARKDHRDQEALLASEMQAKSELAPYDFDFDFDDDDDNDKHHADSPNPPAARTTAAPSRPRAVKQGIKNWVRRLTRRPRQQKKSHHSTRSTPPHPPSANTTIDAPSRTTHHLPLLPGELQNIIIAYLHPAARALLRLSCRHFHTIIPPPTFTTPSPSPFSPPSPPLTPPSSPPFPPHPTPRCHRFAFLTALHRSPSPSPYLPPNWNIHAAVCGAPFYPCAGCKAFHHIDWFAPYASTVQRYPALASRPADCRACVLHTWMPGEEDGLFSPEVWPGLAERVRGWSVGRWWRCECCGRFAREGKEERREVGGEEVEVEAWRAERRAERAARRVEDWDWGMPDVDVQTVVEVGGRDPGRYVTAVQGRARWVAGGGGWCVCGCDVCGMVGVDCWAKGGRRVVLYSK